jgi:hypothetical protein
MKTNKLTLFIFFSFYILCAFCQCNTDFLTSYVNCGETKSVFYDCYDGGGSGKYKEKSDLSGTKRFFYKQLWVEDACPTGTHSVTININDSHRPEGVEVFGEVHFSLNNKIDIEIIRNPIPKWTDFKIPEGEIVKGQSGIFWVEITIKFDTKGTDLEDEEFMSYCFDSMNLQSEYMEALD